MEDTVRPAKRAKLLSDVSSSDEDGEGESTLQINPEYARRFEHNKKREELQRLEEQYSNKSSAKRVPVNGEEEDSDSEDDESEDDEGELATHDVDAEIFDTLQAIRQKDPRVYDQRVRFYKQYEGDDEGQIRKKEEKPMLLSDFHRRNVMDELLPHSEAKAPTYQEEQDAIKRDVVGSLHVSTNGTAGGEEDDDDFMIPKHKPEHSIRPTAPTQQITDTDIASADKDPETYLSNFMAARAWLPNATSRWQAFDSDDSEDEKRAEEFEEAYNLRFEDPAKANEKLQSFARHVGQYGGVRREVQNHRQRARDRERERKEQAKREREEERARLRKLKIEQAEEKVRQIRDAAGLVGRKEELDIEDWRDVLDGDFDEEKWEEEMRRRFGEKYYAANDGDVIDLEGEGNAAGGEKHRKVKKPTWNDDIDIDDLVPEFGKGDTERTFTLSSDGEDENRLEPAQATPKRTPKKSKKQQKIESQRDRRRERRKIESLVDASLPISYPEVALKPQSSSNRPFESSHAQEQPGLGFRYRSTSPVSFGLTSKDILFADDSQLNEFAGLKKMASYRDAEKKRRDRKKFSKKARLREWRKSVFGSEGVPGGAELPNGVGAAANSKREQDRDTKAIVPGQGKNKTKRKAKN